MANDMDNMEIDDAGNVYCHKGDVVCIAPGWCKNCPLRKIAKRVVININASDACKCPRRTYR